MVVRRDSGGGTIEHRTFTDLPDLLESGDILVRNNTRVVPARLVGHREATGGKWEGLFLRECAMPVEGSGWEILATTRGRPREGERIVVGNDPSHPLVLTLVARGEGGRWVVRPESTGSTSTLLERHGQVPLPPYIRKGREAPGDRLRYQTLYATVPGAVAAPTAGLHFTAELLDRLATRGIPTAELTLHVGLGTFRPIEVERIEDHVLHAEWAELTAETAHFLNARSRQARLVAVGTTSARVLETTVTASGSIRPFTGETSLYLRPGHTFGAVGALITNFHLPRSSLLVLVSAFAGVELIREAYAEAVRARYRFYSYGDAMLIV
jgi:S-adenosylmethionine:tRNA ribosyltransferase-isomerase